MLKVTMVFLCAFFFLSAGVAFAAEQVFLKNDLRTWDREDVAGGKGTLAGKFSFTRNDTEKTQAIKEIGWMTLQPGMSIGMHKHENNEDAYIIISGEGLFTDDKGVETVVKAGDITIAWKGQAHALSNSGKEPLIFLDVIGAQE